MAQATDSITFKALVVLLGTDGITYGTDISGESGTVTVDGGERATEETHTFDGDVPIITSGKRGKLSVKVRILYRVTGTTGYTLAKAAYENDTALYVKWRPTGTGVSKKEYYTSRGFVTAPPYPAGEAGSAAPIVFELALDCATISEGTQ